MDAKIILSSDKQAIENAIDSYRPDCKTVTSLIGLYTASFCRKKSGSKSAKKKQELAMKIGVADVDQKAVLQASYNKQVVDFEDGMEYLRRLGKVAGCFLRRM